MPGFLRSLLLLLPISLQAQFTYVLDQSIPVTDEKGSVLTMPWTGGLNAAQYNTMDLNNDGKDDLVLFDRMADKVITFLNQDNQYRYAPEYENFFPPEITNWLLLRDFNCDGKKDIFTGDVLGMKVYTNLSQGSEITWEHFLFYSGFPGSKSQVLLTKGFSGKVNLQLQFDDIPAIADADGDGDLDIFNVRFVGSGTVEFHKNYSIERGYSCDSLDFERVTQQWGGFTECNCGEFAFNGTACPTSGGRVRHAGGKSLLMLDADGNGAQDLVLAEADCNFLSLLENEGTLASPQINSTSAFPSGTPVNFQLFPGAYFEDVDFDGKKDLIATPSIFQKPDIIINLWESNWLYRNTGTDSAPNFVFAKRDFLQENMLDLGDNTVPAFADEDGDGDYDMFVSHGNFPSTIVFYENTGTASAPEFVLTEDDYLNLSFASLYNLRIQFADYNSDNKSDLVFTATDFIDGRTKLYYFINTSSGSLNFSGQSLEETDFTIASTENVLLTHVDRDGRIDLLRGKSNGALEFWKNNGASFSLENGSYLGIGPSVLRQNISCTVSDLDADGKVDLMLSDQTGELRVISDFRESDNAEAAVSQILFNPIKSSVTRTYESRNLGGRLWPVAVNLFSTNKPTIVVGSVLGGLLMLRHDESSPLPVNPVIDIYPNPVAKSEILNIRVDRPARMQLYSSLGHQIIEPFYLQPNEISTFNVSTLAAGVYILRFTVNNKSIAKRFVVR